MAEQSMTAVVLRNAFSVAITRHVLSFIALPPSATASHSQSSIIPGNMALRSTSIASSPAHLERQDLLLG